MTELTDLVPPNTATDITTALGNGTYSLGAWARAASTALEAAEINAAIGPTSTFTYNTDGTVATIVSGGATSSFTYNTNGTVASITRGSDTRTFAYNSDGTVSAIT